MSAWTEEREAEARRATSPTGSSWLRGLLRDALAEIGRLRDRVAVLEAERARADAYIEALAADGAKMHLLNRDGRVIETLWPAELADALRGDLVERGGR